LGSQFREYAFLNCRDGAGEGILDLSDSLQNIYFVGMASDRIQTIVRSRNYRNFDEIEETAIRSRQDRYRAKGSASPRCGSCGKLGYSSNKCVARENRERRVNPVVTKEPESSSIT
jgi:hypothetical protein